MVKLFSIGHISIYLFGLMVALAMVIGIFITNLEAKGKGLIVVKKVKMINLVLKVIEILVSFFSP